MPSQDDWKKSIATSTRTIRLAFFAPLFWRRGERRGCVRKRSNSYLGPFDTAPTFSVFKRPALSHYVLAHNSPKSTISNRSVVFWLVSCALAKTVCKKKPIILFTIKNGRDIRDPTHTHTHIYTHTHTHTTHTHNHARTHIILTEWKHDGGDTWWTERRLHLLPKPKLDNCFNVANTTNSLDGRLARTIPHRHCSWQLILCEYLLG